MRCMERLIRLSCLFIKHKAAASQGGRKKALSCCQASRADCSQPRNSAQLPNFPLPSSSPSCCARLSYLAAGCGLIFNIYPSGFNSLSFSVPESQFVCFPKYRLKAGFAVCMLLNLFFFSLPKRPPAPRQPASHSLRSV